MHALEKEMATHSSILAWRIPGTEEPAGLPSMGSHRVRHDWSGSAAAGSWLLGFDFCKHGLLLGTMMTQWLWTHCVPFYQLGHASQHQREIRKLSTGINYRKEGRNSLAKKQLLWIPGPGTGDGLSAHCHPLPASSLLEGLTLHPFPWRAEVFPLAPWSWADLESWGGQEEM